MTTDSDELAGIAAEDSGVAAETSDIAANSYSDKVDLYQTAAARGVVGLAGEEQEPQNGTISMVSDVQKKIRRAERFGMPVQLSEEEKRNSRAERFGTASKVPCSEASQASEELKRKARAERFGISVPPAPSDDEAKKKARLERFGGPVKEEVVEVEKRKARAMRFSNPPI